MDDLITKRQAVERMNDLMVIELKMTRPPTWNEVYNAIEELPSAQQWIPCSERWPEEYTVVLVSDGEKIGIAYRREYLWYHEEYLGIIVAWMPLPEPYKGEG